MLSRNYFFWFTGWTYIYVLGLTGFVNATKPVLVKSFTARTLFKNENDSLECSFKSPQTNVTWYKDGKLLPSDFLNMKITSRIGPDNVTTGGLKITAVTLSQGGNYSCVGSNKDGSTSHVATLSVYDELETLMLTVTEQTSTSLKLNWYRTKKVKHNDPTHFVNISIYDENILYSNTKVLANIPSLVFKNLKPYTNYTFVVFESIGNRYGNVSSQFGVTKAAAPSAPLNVKVTTSNSSTINIVWQKPDFLNGDVTMFLVTYTYTAEGVNKSNRMELNTTERKAKISGLYPALTYYIAVFERTVALGPAGWITAVTSEGVPQAAPGNVNVKSIDLSVPNRHDVNVTWDPIPEHLRGGILRGYHIYYGTAKDKTDGKKPTKTFVDISNTSHIISNLQAYTSYYLKLVAFTDAGDGVFITKMFETNQGIPSEPRDIEGSAISSHGGESIQVSWQPPDKINGRIEQFQVVYKKIFRCLQNRCKREMELYMSYFDTVNYTRNEGERKHVISRYLDPFSKFSIKVREATAAGYGNYSDVIEVITAEGVPTKPRNVSASDVSDTSAMISWVKPTYPNGKILKYETQIFKGSTLVNRIQFSIYTGNEELKIPVDNLEAETTYTIQIRAFNKHDGQISDPIYFITSETSAKFPWLFVLVGCLITVLLLALIVTILVLLSRRRQQYKEVVTMEDITMTNYPRSKPIAIADLKQYCIQQHANGDYGFNQEYESIKIPSGSFTWEHSQMPYNQVKNRYSNIVAYDHSRVILAPIENDPSSTYINASYVDGFEAPKKYIATQGPLPETVLDFWRMVWEQECPIIVMLAKLVEDSRVKCEQYWPEGKGLQYGEIIVTVQSVSELTDYTVRVFKIHKVNQAKSEQREVHQFHFTSWPDHGVPTHPSSVLSFVRHVMSFMGKSKQGGPNIVHCSAGVGRTGTFIAIEGCLRQMEVGNEVDVYKTVCGMRMQRNFMVQVEPQYTFIYDALLDSVVCGNTEIDPASFIAKIQYLNSKDPKTGETYFAAEFKRLESGITLSHKNQYGDASHPDNKQKNRFLNILPYDKNRVKLLPIAGCRQSDYINASIIDGFQQRNAFIATQAPLEHTVNDFWRMVLEQNVHIIVMLTKLEEKGQEKCYLYWPQADTVSYGSIHVELVNMQNADENLIVHELRLTNRETGRSWAVNHFMYMGWPEYGSPSSGTEIIQLIGIVQSTHRSIRSAGPILVHCSGGVGRTGVFMSVFNSIEKLKAQDVVDIFQTTRALRVQRTAMVQTIDQYMFCYQALKDYLDSFDLYAKPFSNDPKC